LVPYTRIQHGTDGKKMRKETGKKGKLKATGELGGR